MPHLNEHQTRSVRHNLKVRLGQEIVRSFYGDDAAREAFDRFTAMFVKKEVPDDIEEFVVSGSAPISLVDFIAERGFASSKGDARRLIDGGGVSLNSEKVSDNKASFIPKPEGTILKVGKRKFLKVIAKL